MERVKVNARQMFVLIVLFEHGSAIVIPLGVSAKQDVWLAILLSLALGLLLFFVYRCLFEYYPNEPLTAYMQHIVGAPLGKLLAVVYITYFLYIAARVLRDFGELLLTFAYPETPLFVLNAIMDENSRSAVFYFRLHICFRPHCPIADHFLFSFPRNGEIGLMNAVKHPKHASCCRPVHPTDEAVLFKQSKPG